MEKPNKIPQIYGYTICVIAVIAFLISLTNFINAYIDKGDLLYASSYNRNENLASYEIYKMSLLKEANSGNEAVSNKYIPDNTEIKAMYKAAINQKISAASHQNKRALIVSGILGLLSLILFITHLYWVQRLSKKE
ncbi:MAG: hypothetical protein J7J72_04860 [Bacteroidales bacterium]|nr:hypothetical protein [Bacteroidales bacterium]